MATPTAHTPSLEETAWHELVGISLAGIAVVSLTSRLELVTWLLYALLNALLYE